VGGGVNNREPSRPEQRKLNVDLSYNGAPRMPNGKGSRCVGIDSKHLDG